LTDREMTLDPVDVKLFYKFQSFIPAFWARFPAESIDFEGKRILEVGSGHGDLSIDMALKGAREVVGIDIKCPKIAFAESYLSQNYKQLKDIVTFKCCDVSELPLDPFNMIVSKNTFEHISDPRSCLDEMKKRLRPGGKVLIGFSPLYNSPFGDHGRTKTFIPWGHVIFPEDWIMRRLNKKVPERNLNRISDLELNTYSFRNWQELFYSSGYQVFSLQANRGHHILMPVFSLMRKIPVLEEYFTVNLFVVLEKA